MIEAWSKATNRSIQEVIYEGLKKTYDTYEEAFEDMFRMLKDPFLRDISSFRLPSKDKWENGEKCFISSRKGNCISTVYIKES